MPSRGRHDARNLVDRLVGGHFTIVTGAGCHSPCLTASFGTYVRNVSENGLPSDAGSQFDSGTPESGFGPMAIFSDPSASLFGAE